MFPLEIYNVRKPTPTHTKTNRKYIDFIQRNAFLIINIVALLSYVHDLRLSGHTIALYIIVHKRIFLC